MPNYVIQKDSKTAVPLTITQAQADVYALKFPVYLVNADNSRTFYAGPTAPANTATQQDLGVKNASEIADLNAQIAAGTASFTPGSWLTLASSGSDNGTVYRLKGSGTSAAFTVDGGGSAGINKTGIYVPAGWGANWAAKLAAAKAGTALARMAAVGDSLTANQWASNLDTKGLAGLLRESMGAIYGDGGSGFKSSYDNAVQLGTGYTNTIAASSLIALTGTWTVTTSFSDGPGANILAGTTAGATATYVVRGTTVETFVLQRSAAAGATYNISIDGVQVPGGPFATANLTDGVQKKTVSGLAPGNHTVVITVVDVTNGNLSFNGVRGSNASGFILDKYGRGSYPSAAFKNGSNYTFTQSNGTVIGGAGQGTIAEAGKWSGGSSNPCDLAVWALGANDCRFSGAETTPDAYLQNLRGWLDDVKDGVGATGTTDVLILMQHAGSPSWQTSLKYYPVYCERAADMARAYGAAFVNLWALGNNSYNWMLTQGYMGNATSGGASGSDLIHLSDLGFKWQHDIIKPIIAL